MSERPLNDMERDAGLEALYRAAGAEEPSAALDDTIRAAAHRAVSFKPHPAGASFSRAWRVSLSIAAVILLSVSLVTVMREEAPELTQPPAPDALPRMPRADREASGATPGSAERAAAEPRQASNEAKSSAPPAEATARAPAAATAPAAVPGAASADMAQMKSEADSAAREAQSGRSELVAPAASPAPAAAARSQPPQRESQLAGAVQTHADWPPGKWLEHIAELHKLGKLEEAKVSLAEFRKRYPDYPLPAWLRDGIKP